MYENSDQGSAALYIQILKIFPPENGENIGAFDSQFCFL
jgi:hypothetical protein